MGLFGAGKVQEGDRADLRARVAALEKRMAEVEFEWSSWYDKFKMLHARWSKRQREVPEEAPTPHVVDAEHINALIRTGHTKEVLDIINNGAIHGRTLGT